MTKQKNTPKTVEEFLEQLDYKNIDLSKIPTVPEDSLIKKEIKKKTKKMQKKIANYQQKMMAQWKYSILLILQWLDASWKDGAIKKVLTWVNPAWVKVYDFKVPTKEEKAHDFLWRVHSKTPKRWMMTVFNRSHYEDILVPTVEWYANKELLKNRYENTVNFEELLSDNDTKIVKIFLHASKASQKVRLLERLENPKKFYKHNDWDWITRWKWDKYINVYQTIFSKTHMPKAPWYIVPTDYNWYKEYLVTKYLLQAFKEMKLKWPDLNTNMG